MLAEHVDGVIGVDTHRDTLAALSSAPSWLSWRPRRHPLTAAAIGVFSTSPAHVPGRRCWALEGTGSYGAGLAAFLEDAGEQVVEVCRPKRPPVRGERKTDMLDAVRAAREALATEHVIQPRKRGESEAMRVLLAARQGAVHASTAAINQLKALIISARDDLRAELRRLSRPAQVTHCAGLLDCSALSTEHRMTIRALRSTAQRIRHLQVEARELERELLQLVHEHGPGLLELLGIGAITATEILVSWSHPGRFRCEAAFASFAGVAPIPASSGLTNKQRQPSSRPRQ
nr:transposase [Streptomyces jeddahensis]